MKCIIIASVTERNQTFINGYMYISSLPLGLDPVFFDIDLASVVYDVNLTFRSTSV